MHNYIKTEYPDAKAFTNVDGTVVYVVHKVVGGVDREGEYLLVLEGPASGEKVYMDEWNG